MMLMNMKSMKITIAMKTMMDTRMETMTRTMTLIMEGRTPLMVMTMAAATETRLP